MKKIIYLLLLFPILVNAQIKLVGKVIDAKTKQEIPYVNIENFRIQAGTQTNQAGLFELNMPNAKQSDILKISCVGYADKYVSDLSSNEAVIYELLPVVFQLNEVKVSNKKPTEIEVGILNESGYKWEMLNPFFQNPGTQNAIYFKNDGYKSAFLKSLHFFMGSEMFDAPFRIHIYENDNRKPGKDLINKSIEYDATEKNSWNVFDISEYNLMMPENGLWVSVEWIANEKYKKTIITDGKLADGSIKTFNVTYYGPEIVARIDTDFGLTYRKSIGKSKWKKNIGRTQDKNSGKWRSANIDIMIKATLAVYN